MPLGNYHSSGAAYLGAGGRTFGRQAQMSTASALASYEHAPGDLVPMDGVRADFSENQDAPSFAEANGKVIAIDDSSCNKKTTALVKGEAPKGYKKVLDKYWSNGKLKNGTTKAMKCEATDDCTKKCVIQIEYGIPRGGLKARTHYCACTDAAEKTDSL